MPQLKKITITNIWHSTPILTCDALSKWHESDTSNFLFKINLFALRLCKYIWKTCHRMVFWHELGQLFLCQKCVYLSEWCLCHFVSTLWLIFDEHDCCINVWIFYFICHSSNNSSGRSTWPGQTNISIWLTCSFWRNRQVKVL